MSASCSSTTSVVLGRFVGFSGELSSLSELPLFFCPVEGGELSSLGLAEPDADRCFRGLPRRRGVRAAIFARLPFVVPREVSVYIVEEGSELVLLSTCELLGVVGGTIRGAWSVGGGISKGTMGLDGKLGPAELGVVSPGVLTAALLSFSPLSRMPVLILEPLEPMFVELPPVPGVPLPFSPLTRMPVFFLSPLLLISLCCRISVSLLSE